MDSFMMEVREERGERDGQKRNRRDHQKKQNFLGKKFFVNKIGLFGSYVREQQTEESDVDILVEFSKPVSLEFFDLKEYLESVLNKKVDLVTVRALKPTMKERILKEVRFQ